MSDSSQTVTLVCTCGSDKFSSNGEGKADTVMTCVKCGKSATYGNLLEQAKQQITKQYADVISNMFKKR